MRGKFNFLYIPLDKGTMANVGYAFVNFINEEWTALLKRLLASEEWARKCMEAFSDYRFKRHRKTSGSCSCGGFHDPVAGKIASVSAAHLQGLEANLAHYERAVAAWLELETLKKSTR